MLYLSTKHSHDIRSAMCQSSLILVRLSQTAQNRQGINRLMRSKLQDALCISIMTELQIWIWDSKPKQTANHYRHRSINCRKVLLTCCCKGTRKREWGKKSTYLDFDTEYLRESPLCLSFILSSCPQLFLCLSITVDDTVQYTRTRPHTITVEKCVLYWQRDVGVFRLSFHLSHSAFYAG